MATPTTPAPVSPSELPPLPAGALPPVPAPATASAATGKKRGRKTDAERAALAAAGLPTTAPRNKKGSSESTGEVTHVTVRNLDPEIVKAVNLLGGAKYVADLVVSDLKRRQVIYTAIDLDKLKASAG